MAFGTTVSNPLVPRSSGGQTPAPTTQHPGLNQQLGQGQLPGWMTQGQAPPGLPSWLTQGGGPPGLSQAIQGAQGAAGQAGQAGQTGQAGQGFNATGGINWNMPQLQGMHQTLQGLPGQVEGQIPQDAYQQAPWLKPMLDNLLGGLGNMFGGSKQ